MSINISSSKITPPTFVSMPDIITARICGFVGEAGRDRPALRSTCHLFNKVIGSASFSALEKSLKTKSIHYLHWTQRPSDVQSAIDRAFEWVSSTSSSDWGMCNGSRWYDITGINEMALIKSIIQKAPVSRKNFYVLDIGAGNFQWGEQVAKEMQEVLRPRTDAVLHIYGVRGERHTSHKPISNGQCIRYELGSFKAEEISTEFARHGHEIGDNTFDLVISQWSFRHFADPVETWAQTYDKLRPSGFFIFDGFFFNTQDDLTFDSYPEGLRGNFNMMNLLKDSGAPFLMKNYDALRSLNHFILQKPNSQRCRLPMSYISVIKDPTLAYCQVHSLAVTKFHRTHSDWDLLWPEGNILSGDGGLYKTLKTRGVLEKNYRGQFIPWEPGVKSQCTFLRKKFYDAVSQSDQETLSLMLNEGFNMNFAIPIEKSTDSVSTSSEVRYISPIRLAIQNKNYDVFEQLLDAGARIDYFSRSKNEGSAIEEAITTHKSGIFLQMLLNHPDAECFFVESLNELPTSAFSLAKKLQNTKAIALIKAYQQKNRASYS